MDASVVMCVVHGVSAAVHLKACPLALSASEGPCRATNDLEPLRQPLPAALLLLIQHWAVSSGTGCA